MRNKFDDELLKLDTQLIEMGALIEEAIRLACSALLNKDLELAHKAIDFEKLIDSKEREIETFCFKLIVEQQPVARDFRIISTALKIITDMERIGDHAQDISEISIQLTKNNYDAISSKVLSDLQKMSEATIKMVKESIDSFVKKNTEHANNVIEYDDVVDELFDVVKKDLVSFIANNTDNASHALDLLMVAKYFERIGDHAVNIAEWIIYQINGEHIKQ